MDGYEFLKSHSSHSAIGTASECYRSTIEAQDGGRRKTEHKILYTNEIIREPLSLVCAKLKGRSSCGVCGVGCGELGVGL